MSTPNITTQNQAKVWINGQYRTAVNTNGKWYVEIDGKRIEVDPNDIFGINSNITECPQRQVDYYDRLLSENEEKKDYLQETAKNIKEQLKNANEKFNALLSNLGVTSYRQITDSAKYTEAKEQYQNIAGLKHDKVSNSNRYFSACLYSFDLALDKGNWLNQLGLAQNIAN